MIKMVVSDFDNTMVNYKNGISDYQIEVLKKLKDKGIVFSIVTGRSVSFFKQFPKLLEVIDYIISSNGGAIYDVRNYKFLYNNCIKRESLEKLISYGISNDFTFVLNELGQIYKYGNLKKIDSVEFDNNRQYLCEQIIFYVKKQYFNMIKETVNNIDDVVINNVNNKNDRCTIDINDKSVSKGNSVLWLCKYINISSDDVVAFGDGENDISMFKVVGKSICVDNACMELKKYADEITGSWSENGVFKYIENNILK